MEVTFKINWLNNKHQGFKVTMKGQFEDDGGKGKRFFSGGESLQHCVERLITDIVRTRIM